jgi:hypothetical protein
MEPQRVRKQKRVTTARKPAPKRVTTARKPAPKRVTKPRMAKKTQKTAKSAKTEN